MRRAASSLGVRTALIAGLVVSLFGPASAPALADDCPGQLEIFNGQNQPPASSVARGSQFLMMFGGGPPYENYEVFVQRGGSYGVVLTTGQDNTNVNGSAFDELTMPSDAPVGAGQVLFHLESGCTHVYPITITLGLSLNPGVTLTTVPTFNPNPGVTLTTTTPTTTTSTTTVPAAPASSSATTAPSSPASEASSSTTAVTSTSPASSSTLAAASPVSSSTSTTLVAASNASADQGPPWTVWLIGGLIGLAIVSAAVGTMIRRRVRG